MPWFTVSNALKRSLRMRNPTFHLSIARNVVLMLGQCPKPWASINDVLAQRLVFVGHDIIIGYV